MIGRIPLRSIFSHIDFPLSGRFLNNNRSFFLSPDQRILLLSSFLVTDSFDVDHIGGSDLLRPLDNFSSSDGHSSGFFLNSSDSRLSVFWISGLWHSDVRFFASDLRSTDIVESHSRRFLSVFNSFHSHRFLPVLRSFDSHGFLPVFCPVDSNRFIDVFHPFSVRFSSVLDSGLGSSRGVDLRGSGRSDFSLWEVLVGGGGTGWLSEVDFGAICGGSVNFDVVGVEQSEL